MIDENFAFFPQKIFVVSRILLIFATSFGEMDDDIEES
jgi:hypothetical protein